MVTSQPNTQSSSTQVPSTAGTGSQNVEQQNNGVDHGTILTPGSTAAVVTYYLGNIQNTAAVTVCLPPPWLG